MQTSWRWLSAVLGVAVVASLVVATVATSLRATPFQAVALGLGVVVAVAGVVLTLTNFWVLVLTVLFLRISLDGLKTGGTVGASALDPATLIGGAFIALAIIWMIGAHLRGEYRRSSLATKLLYGLSAAAFLSATGSYFPVVAVTSATKLFAGVLMLAVLEQVLPGRPDRVRQLLATVLASAAIPLTVGIRQAMTGAGDLSTPGFNRVLGTAVHPVAFATYLLVVFLVAVALFTGGPRRFRPATGGLAAASAVVLLLTYTRSAWLIAAVGVVMLVTRVNRRFLLPLAGLLAMVPVFRPDVIARFADLQNQQTSLAGDDAANSLVWRFDYWGEVLAESADNRVTGTGLDTTQLLTPLGLKPHNIFVQALAETGVVGLMLMILAFAAIGLQLRERRRLAVTPLERLTAATAIVVAACIFAQALATNPLAGTMAWWYLAAAMTYGFASQRGPGYAPAPRPDRSALASGPSTSAGERAAAQRLQPVG